MELSLDDLLFLQIKRVKDAEEVPMVCKLILVHVFSGNILQGHSMSNHPMVETVPPPPDFDEIYTFGLYGQKRRFAK